MANLPYTPLYWKLDTQLIGKTILHYSQCASTQDLLKQWGATSNIDGWVIIADRQHQGRGQHQRTWTDMGGPQLFMSICVPFPFSLDVVPIMNLWMGIVILETLKAMAPSLDLAIKWPNDVYVQEKKIGGILSELFVQHKETNVHMGCGINVSQPKSRDLSQATSLEHLGVYIDPMELAKLLIERLDHGLQQPSFTTIFSYIEKTFLQNALFKGQQVQVTSQDRQIEGIIVGLTKQGGLLLETPNGDKVYTVSGKLSAVQAHKEQKQEEKKWP